MTLIRSPANIASRRSRDAGLLGEGDEQPQRLVGDAVLRVVDEDPRRLAREPLGAARIGREEVAQVRSPHLLRVRLESLPGDRLPEWRGQIGHRRHP